MDPEYIRSFVIGSSFPVVLPFIYSVANTDDKKKNYSYKTYSFLAPLYLGIMNVLALYLADKYDWSLRKRLLIIGSLSPIIVIIIGRLYGSYNYDDEEWKKYYMYIFIKHFLIFNLLIYFIENSI